MGTATSVLATLVLAFVPGLVLGRATDRRLAADPVLLVAAAPVWSVGLVATVARWSGLAGMPLLPWTPLLVAGVLAAVSVPAIVAGRGTTTTPTGLRNRADPARTRPDTAEGRAAIALLATSMAVGVTVWAVGLAGQPAEPPRRDGLYHGFFVARMVAERSVDPATVLVTDPVTAKPAASFYPLALHATVAVQRLVAGGAVGRLLVLWTALAAAVVLPAGMFCLVRRLVPDRPVVAGCAALAVPCFALFPYRPMDWSGIGVIVGLAMVPVTVALVDRAVRAGPAAQAGAALAVTATGTVHTSQAALLVLVLGVLQVAALASDTPAGRRTRVVALARVGVGAAVLCLPTLVALGTATEERAAFQGAADQQFRAALRGVVELSHAMPTGGQPVLAAAALVGALVAVRRRVLGAWAVVTVGLVGLHLAATVAAPPWTVLHPLTAPWYGSSWRTSYHLPLAAAPFVGLAVAELSRGAAVAWSRLRRTTVTEARTAPLVAVVLAGALLWSAAPDAVGLVRSGFRTDSPVVDGQAAAFRWLDRHVPAGATVLNEERDGSGWMYADRGLRPLLAVYAYGSTPENDPRLWLLEHIGRLGGQPRVDRLVRRFGVTHVLVNERTFTGEPSRLDAGALAANPRLRPVFRSRGTTVLRVLPPPAAGE